MDSGVIASIVLAVLLFIAILVIIGLVLRIRKFQAQLGNLVSPIPSPPSPVTPPRKTVIHANMQLDPPFLERPIVSLRRPKRSDASVQCAPLLRDSACDADVVHTVHSVSVDAHVPVTDTSVQYEQTAVPPAYSTTDTAEIAVQTAQQTQHVQHSAVQTLQQETPRLQQVSVQTEIPHMDIHHAAVQTVTEHARVQHAEMQTEQLAVDLQHTGVQTVQQQKLDMQDTSAQTIQQPMRHTSMQTITQQADLLHVDVQTDKQHVHVLDVSTMTQATPHKMAAVQASTALRHVDTVYDADLFRSDVGCGEHIETAEKCIGYEAQDAGDDVENEMISMEIPPESQQWATMSSSELLSDLPEHVTADAGVVLVDAEHEPVLSPSYTPSSLKDIMAQLLDSYARGDLEQTRAALHDMATLVWDGTDLTPVVESVEAHDDPHRLCETLLNVDAKDASNVLFRSFPHMPPPVRGIVADCLLCVADMLQNEVIQTMVRDDSVTSLSGAALRKTLGLVSFKSLTQDVCALLLRLDPADIARHCSSDDMCHVLLRVFEADVSVGCELLTRIFAVSKSDVSLVPHVKRVVKLCPSYIAGALCNTTVESVALRLISTVRTLVEDGSPWKMTCSWRAITAALFFVLRCVFGDTHTAQLPEDTCVLVAPASEQLLLRICSTIMLCVRASNLRSSDFPALFVARYPLLLLELVSAHPSLAAPASVCAWLMQLQPVAIISKLQQQQSPSVLERERVMNLAEELARSCPWSAIASVAALQPVSEEDAEPDKLMGRLLASHIDSVGRLPAPRLHFWSSCVQGRVLEDTCGMYATVVWRALAPLRDRLMRYISAAVEEIRGPAWTWLGLHIRSDEPGASHVSLLLALIRAIPDDVFVSGDFFASAALADVVTLIHVVLADALGACDKGGALLDDVRMLDIGTALVRRNSVFPFAPASAFYMPQLRGMLGDVQEMVEAVTGRSTATALHRTLQALFRRAPWLFEIDIKEAVLRQSIRPVSGPIDKLEVTRDFLLLSAMKSFAKTRPSLTAPRDWRVSFSGEPAIDIKGVRREFCTYVCGCRTLPHSTRLLARAVVAPEQHLFIEYDGGFSFDPNSERFNAAHARLFEFLGHFTARALQVGEPLDIRLCRFIFKRLLSRRISVFDVAAIDLSLLKNKLLWMCNNSIDGVVSEQFVCDGVELCAGGGSLTVTDENKHVYITQLTNYLLNDRIAVQMNAFVKGFSQVIAPRLLEHLSEEELEALLCGSSDIDVSDLRQHTRYTCGYSADSEPVRMFWEVLDSWPAQQRQRLLQFVTGSARVPAAGAARLSPPFTVQRIIDTQRLPSAATCFNTLKLPAFTSKDAMAAALLQAVQEACTGFAFS